MEKKLLFAIHLPFEGEQWPKKYIEELKMEYGFNVKNQE